jgi:hypothetical protein
MSTGAVIMLVLAILIVWGGLAASILALRRHPDQPDEPSA